ncbi:serine protease [Luteolibacter flavescens]|uniref:Serine protease n=1 Tax=Luteolibacter flavescens TaxID=1859460 RepID=A0ABT3FTY4_9BACT|nr:serine protease [Luteolibacter flavescens]MCW1886997.1 serine protease [Luteolibacter flavescens]
MSGTIRLGLALLSLSLPVIADDTADLARLRTLVREHAAGMTFPSVKAKDGKVFKDVTVTEVSAQAVKFHHDKGDATLPAENCPEIWAELFGFGVKTSATEPSAKPTLAKHSDTAVAEAIAVIEGDRGTGTGFFCRDGDTTYLYSAAHVLSGNSRLKVKLRDGTVIRKFGALEAAEGADLIRLPVNEPVPMVLEIAAATGVSKVGTPVMASGNAGGGGTVGFEKGEVKGVGPESIEIDAQVIQGNSGGPILHGETQQALGVVTHLTAERKDHWAKGTRFADVRRFGCRLDRTWKWKQVPVEAFLKEGKSILAVQQQTELMIAAMQPDKWQDDIFQQLRGNPLARDIAALQSFMAQQQAGTQRMSESDRKKRLRGIFEGARHRSRAQMAEFKSDSFTWFHRETAQQEVKTREEIDKAYADAVNEMR